MQTYEHIFEVLHQLQLQIGTWGSEAEVRSIFRWVLSITALSFEL